MTTTTDILGNPIEVGSILTYPVRQSSSMWMSYSVVERIELIKPYWRDELQPFLYVTYVGKPRWSWKSDQPVTVRKTSISRVDRVTVLPLSLLRPDENEAHLKLMEISATYKLNAKRHTTT